MHSLKYSSEKRIKYNVTNTLPNLKKLVKDFEGTGEILQVKAEPQDGMRDLKMDDNGSISAETYRQIPSSYVIQRAGDKPGKIALTFDDGPDPVWTPKIRSTNGNNPVISAPANNVTPPRRTDSIESAGNSRNHVADVTAELSVGVSETMCILPMTMSAPK